MLMGTWTADFEKYSSEFIKGIRLLKTLMEDISAIVSVYMLANYILSQDLLFACSYNPNRRAVTPPNL